MRASKQEVQPEKQPEGEILKEREGGKNLKTTKMFSEKFRRKEQLKYHLVLLGLQQKATLKWSTGRNQGYPFIYALCSLKDSNFPLRNCSDFLIFFFKSKIQTNIKCMASTFVGRVTPYNCDSSAKIQLLLLLIIRCQAAIFLTIYLTNSFIVFANYPSTVRLLMWSSNFA